MQQTNNVWIQTKKHEIEAIKRQLIEYDYAGSYGGAINLMQVNNMLDGCMIEILKLQLENETLKKEVNKLTPKKPVEVKVET
jgi:hypothetical protein